MSSSRQRAFGKRDRVRQLRAFCNVARLQSFTQAAVQLGLSPPAVSLHVRELERELGAVLFERSAASIGLTSAGKTFLELAEPLVQGIDALPQYVSACSNDTTSGWVRLAATVAGAAFVLPPYVKTFRDTYPRVRLRVENCLLGEGLTLLLEDEVEFMLGAKDAHPWEAFEYRELLTYDLVLITSLDHALAGRSTVSPQEAAQWPTIVPPIGTYSRQFGETAAKQFGVDVKAVIEVGGWGVIKRYVESGLGISVIPSICVSKTDRLSVVSLGEYFPSRSFGVFTRHEKAPTPLARRFLQHMIPGFP